MSPTCELHSHLILRATTKTHAGRTRHHSGRILTTNDAHHIDNQYHCTLGLLPCGCMYHQTEQRAIKLLLDVWKEKAASSRLHIAHLADAESLPMIIDAKRSGMNVTVETCPQYLYFTEDEIPDRSTLHKCAVRCRNNVPPDCVSFQIPVLETIRRRENVRM